MNDIIFIALIAIVVLVFLVGCIAIILKRSHRKVDQGKALIVNTMKERNDDSLQVVWSGR